MPPAIVRVTKDPTGIQISNQWLMTIVNNWSHPLHWLGQQTVWDMRIHLAYEKGVHLTRNNFDKRGFIGAHYCTNIKTSALFRKPKHIETLTLWIPARSSPISQELWPKMHNFMISFLLQLPRWTSASEGKSCTDPFQLDVITSLTFVDLSSKYSANHTSSVEVIYWENYALCPNKTV